MKQALLLLVFGIFISGHVKGQIKIGDNPQNIDPSSVLELESNSRVLVITRINTEQMNAIVPSAGAIVYNTDLQCIHYYDGAQWINVCEEVGGIPNLTTDPLVNTNSTLVITPNGENNHIEVAPNSIRTEQIVDGGINGDDIQDNSIGQSKIGNDAVGRNEIAENAVGLEALDTDQITLSNFNNTPGFITGAEIVSSTPGNAITDNGGAFYNDQGLQNDISTNTSSIGANTNNIQTNTSDIALKEDAVNKSDNTALGNSPILFPTQNAVKTYVDTQIAGSTQTVVSANTPNSITLGSDGGALFNAIPLQNGINANTTALGTKEDLANKTTDINLGNSNTLYPSQNAVKTYVDNIVGGSTQTIVSANTPNSITLGTDGGALFNAIPLQNGITANTNNLATHIANDDTDDSNELTDLAFNTTTNILSLSNSATIPGATVNLSSLDGGGTQDLTSVLTQGNVGAGLLIKNIGNPIDPQDVATKAYVDAGVSGGSQNLTQVLTIGSSAGNSQINDLLDPTLPQDAATKAYVDTNLGGTQDLTSVLANGDSAGNSQIKDLLDPTLPQDAATMAYVDAEVAAIGTPIIVSANLPNSITLGTDGGALYNDSDNDLTNEIQNIAEVLTDGNDAAGALIKNISDPVDPQDAATRAYVDANSGGTQNLNQVLTVGNDAGAVQIENLLDPNDNQDAATKKYVDDSVVAAGGGVPTDELNFTFEVNAGNLEITDNGGTLAVPLTDIDTNNEIQNLTQVLAQGADANATVINNLADPIVAQDAATKAYVDTEIATVGAFTIVGSDAGNLITASGIDGGALLLSVDDADPNPNNEIQNLTQVLAEGADANATIIANVADPVAAQDAATKVYVDTEIATVGAFTIVGSDAGNLITASGIDGGALLLSVDDADPNPNNEIQNLTQVLAEGADANATVIANVADPVAAQDAATKAYVDTEIATVGALTIVGSDAGNLITASVIDGGALLLSVDDADADPANEIQTLTEVLAQGADANATVINNLANPLVAQDAATKAYVDAEIATVGAPTIVSGDAGNLIAVGTDNGALLVSLNDADADPANEIQTLTEVLTQGADANATVITNLADPVVAQDAATKAYVDAEVASGGAPTIVSADAGNLIAVGTDNGALLVSVNDADADPANEIELPIGGTNGQVLSTDGAGNYSWADDATTGGTIVSTDTGNDITTGTDGGAFYDDLTLTTITAANTAAILLKEDSANKSIDVTLADGTNTLFPTELAVKTYVDTEIASISGGTNLSNTDLTQIGGNRTYDLDGQDLYFSGTGNIGIGNTNPQNKFHVSGEIRSEGFNSTQGTVSAPAYSFSTGNDSDTGMWRDGADELVFSAGGSEILRLTESGGGNLDAIVSGQLELNSELIDINNVSGTAGQILSSTGAGVDWIDAPSGGGTIVSADVGNLITAGTDGGALIVTVDDADADPNNEIELPTGGTSGQVLSTDGTGNYTWADDATAGGTIVSTDAGNLIAAGTDGGALIVTVDDADADPNNEIELPAGGTSGQVLSTDGTGNYTWADDADSGGTIVSTDSGNLIAAGTDGGALIVTVDDADADPANEIQTLSVSIPTSELTISGTGGNTVTVPNIYTANSTLTGVGDRTVNLGSKNLTFNGTGRVGIGIFPTAKLHVNGDIRAEGAITASGLITESVPDYVFQKYFTNYSALNPAYNFSDLNEIEYFIKANHHLPGTLSAEGIKKQGFWDLGEASKINLEKIEELFLHTIEQEKKIDQLKNENESIAEELDTLKKELEVIKNLIKKN